MNLSSTAQALSVCFLVAAVCTLPAAGAPDTAQERDQKLVKAIQAAIEKELEPGKVESSVGTKATLNTIRKGDADTLSGADIVADRDAGPAMGDRDAISHVAYWIRPVDSRNPRLVGIVWPKNGKPRIFFGELLPPR
jgi:hypothetical protein